MKIIVGKTAGFCFGVKNAVEKTKEILLHEKNIYCLGEIVHNRQVVQSLEKQGIIFVDDIEKAKNKMIIRAHGVSTEIYNRAREKEINLIDLTCPKVLKVHKIVKEYAEKNYYIFLLGERKHPETIGTISFCGECSTVIEDENEVEDAIIKFKESKLKKALLISQTTYSLEKFEKIKKILQSKNIELEIRNTICPATKLRQEETEEISKKVDLMIIVGGKNSSNTQKLYYISKNNCKNAIHIETKEELAKIDISKYNKIGIMAGASTPNESIEEVVEFIKKI